jgi:hypothetical protein
MEFLISSLGGIPLGIKNRIDVEFSIYPGEFPGYKGIKALLSNFCVKIFSQNSLIPIQILIGFFIFYCATWEEKKIVLIFQWELFTIFCLQNRNWKHSRTSAFSGIFGGCCGSKCPGK